MFHVLYFFGGLLALGLSGRRCGNKDSQRRCALKICSNAMRVYVAADVAGQPFVYCRLTILLNCPQSGAIGQLGSVCQKCGWRMLCVMQSVILR